VKPPARAVLYVRVSTKEQTVENQERELRAWAERLADTARGARSDRPPLAEVLAARA
jgi:DNA invertase Pin-like site-specific DNA recombinase